MKLTFQLAFHFMRSSLNAKKGGWIYFLALIGIIFSVTATILVLSVLAGFEKSYQKSLLGFNAHVLITDQEENGHPDLFRENFFKTIDEHQEIKKQIKHQMFFKIAEGLTSLSGEIRTIRLKALNFKEINKVYDLKYHFDRQWAENNYGILVGKNIYFQLKDKTKLKVWLASNLEEFSLSDNSLDLNVIGYFESGLYEFDAEFVFIDLNYFDELNHQVDDLHGFELKLYQPYQAELLSANLRSKLFFNHEVVSWIELNAELFKAMKTETFVFSLIMGLVILISSFNIIGVSINFYLKNAKEFFMLKLLGLSEKKLKFLVFLQGIYLSLVGSVLGILIANFLIWTLKEYQWFQLASDVYFLSHLPVSFNFLRDGLVLVFCVMICSLVAYISIHASLKQKSENILREF